MSNPPVDFEDWDITDVAFGVPVAGTYGFTIPIKSAATGLRIQVKCPPMKTWGIDQYKGKNPNEDTILELTKGKRKTAAYTANLEFPQEATDTSSSFQSVMETFEHYCISSALEKSTEWFGDEKVKTYEILKDSLSSIFKRYKIKNTQKVDPTKRPFLQTKFPFYDGVWESEVYDSSRNLIFPRSDADPLTIIPKPSVVKAVFQPASIFISNTKGWNININAVQYMLSKKRVVEPLIANPGVCMLDAEDDDDEEQGIRKRVRLEEDA